ncbi:unnamed protein product, partial [Porites evermanni]
ANYICVYLLTGCGVRPSGTRIRGGEEATPHSWPWQASLRYDGEHICGASLVTPEWLVTAAHCVSADLNAGKYQIVLGAHDKKNDGEVYDVSKVEMHEDYNSWTGMKHDVAVVKLSRPAKLGKKISTICLPSQGSRVKIGAECYVTGWGRTRPIIASITAARLKQTKAPPATFNDCKRQLGQRVDDDAMVCVGGKGSSPCHGDSGGPLSCLENGRWILRGSASWVSSFLCRKRKYSVYARVSSYIDWINERIQG